MLGEGGWVAHGHKLNVVIYLLLGLFKPLFIPCQAVEAYRNPRGSSERFAKPLLLHGCLKIPMGNLSKVKIPKPQVTSAAKMDRGKFFHRCGVQTDCPSDQFSLYVYTGRDMHDEAKICYQVFLGSDLWSCTPCTDCMYRLHVQTACTHCMYTLHVHTACTH